MGIVRILSSMVDKSNQCNSCLYLDRHRISEYLVEFNKYS